MVDQLLSKTLGKKPKSKRSKYGNIKIAFQGKKFDSIGERNRYIYLLDAQRRGVIKSLNCQVSFDLIVNDVKVCRYVADFVYDRKTVHPSREREGKIIETVDVWDMVVEDFKGMVTPMFKLKAKLMLACLGISVRVVKSPTAVIS